MAFIRSRKRYVPFEITLEHVRRKKMFGHVTIPWDDVVAVHAVQKDMITYDDNVIVFSGAYGRTVSIAMLDVNFEKLSELLLEKFGIAADWQTPLEVAGSDVWFTLYERDETPK